MLITDDPHVLEQEAADLDAQATRADGGGAATEQGQQLRTKALALRKRAGELRQRRTDGVRFA